MRFKRASTPRGLNRRDFTRSREGVRSSPMRSRDAAGNAFKDGLRGSTSLVAHRVHVHSETRRDEPSQPAIGPFSKIFLSVVAKENISTSPTKSRRFFSFYFPLRFHAFSLRTSVEGPLITRNSNKRKRKRAAFARYDPYFRNNE